MIVSTTRPNLNAVAFVPLELNNQVCSTGFCVLRPLENLASEYLFAFTQSSFFVQELSNLVKGSMYPAVTDDQVRAQLIPLPKTISEQRRIAAILSERMQAIEKARTAVEKQLKAANLLSSAYLRSIFESEEAKTWKRKKVSDLCSKIDYGFTASADFTVTEPRFLRITDIQNGRVNWDSVPGCQISKKEEEANRLIDGDIVFARTGATTGKSFLIKTPPCAVFASYLIRLRLADGVLSEFIYAFFQSNSYWEQIRASARGGAQPNVNATLLGNIILPVPDDIDIQRRICEKLRAQFEAIDKSITSLQQQLKTINKLPAAFLRQAFNGEL